MNMEYIVVTSKNLQRLEEQVNDLLSKNEGWTVNGGLVVVNDEKYGTDFFQAMIKIPITTWRNPYHHYSATNVTTS